MKRKHDCSRRRILTGFVAICLAAAACTEEPRRQTTPVANTTPSFTDVTESSGLDGIVHRTGARDDFWLPETMGSGAGWIDYDGDRDQDVLVVAGGTWDADDGLPAVRLFRNQGNGSFGDATTEAGLDATTAYGMGLAVADIDNDGDDDFYLTALGRNLLFVNDNGRFDEQAGARGVAGADVWSTAAMFFDADADGDVDLLVGNYVSWSPDEDLWCSNDGKDKTYCTPMLYDGVQGVFYLNDGLGAFTEATDGAGLGAMTGKTLGISATDFNNDGALDVVVANDTDPDQLFENRGDATFIDRSITSGIGFDERGRARAGMGIDAGYLSSTDTAWVFVGNFAGEMLGVYRHHGNGVFVERSAATRIGLASLNTLTFGLFLFDVDLDGDQDLFVANGHIQPEIGRIRDNTTYRQRPHLFIYDDGRFTDVAAGVGTPLTDSLVARGAAYADYDLDGDLDILITENAGPLHLWRNDVRSGNDREPHYITIDVRGSESVNRSGIGASVTVFSAVGARRQMVRSGGSYLSASQLPLTFGIGTATVVDSVVVAWPGGRTQRFARVDADTVLHVTGPILQ